MVGHALGALLGGIVMHRSGARFAFLLTAIWLAVACLIFFVLNQFFSFLPINTIEIVDSKLTDILENEESDDILLSSDERSESLDEEKENDQNEKNEIEKVDKELAYSLIAQH